MVANMRTILVLFFAAQVLEIRFFEKTEVDFSPSFFGGQNLSQFWGGGS
jgi:hypothetical protein